MRQISLYYITCIKKVNTYKDVHQVIDLGLQNLQTNSIFFQAKPFNYTKVLHPY